MNDEISIPHSAPARPMEPSRSMLRSLFGAMAHELINAVGTVSVHLQMSEVQLSETAGGVEEALASIRKAEEGTQDLVSLLQLLGEWAESFADETPSQKIALAKRLVQVHLQRYAFPETKVEVLDEVEISGQIIFKSNEPSLFDLSRSSLALQMLAILLTPAALQAQSGDADLRLYFGRGRDNCDHLDGKS